MPLQVNQNPQQPLNPTQRKFFLQLGNSLHNSMIAMSTNSKARP